MLLNQYYQLKADAIKRLSGYDDANYRISDSRDGKKYLLKIINHNDTCKSFAGKVSQKDININHELLYPIILINEFFKLNLISDRYCLLDYAKFTYKGGKISKGRYKYALLFHVQDTWIGENV